MNFNRTENELALYDSVLAFTDSELRPLLSTISGTHQFDEAAFRSLWEVCANFGVLRWPAPTDQGGHGHSVTTTAYLMEALGYGCNDNGLPFALGTQMWGLQRAILQFGNSSQVSQYLSKMLSGNKIGSFAINETGSGSDALSLATSAILDQNHYTLNGEKSLISLSPIADYLLVLATTNPDAGRWGITAFLVDTNLPGITLHPADSMMGLSSIPIGNITFDQCKVPVNNLLGKEGAGSAVFASVQSWERTLLAAPQIGAMQRIIESCVVLAKSRSRNNQKIGKYQAISHKIANMKIKMEASRLLLQKASWGLDQNKQSMIDASIAKTFISESFVEICHEALLIHGGDGYKTDQGIEHNLRDAIGGTLYGGTSDMQRNVIASLIGL